jgi:hypothetical protein
VRRRTSGRRTQVEHSGRQPVRRPEDHAEGGIRLRSSSFEAVRPTRRVPVGPGLSPRLRREDARPRALPLARPRRRRMTPRGRATLAVLVALGFAGGWWSAQRVLGVLRGDAGSTAALPPVASGPGVWNRQPPPSRGAAAEPVVVEEPPPPPPPAPEAVLRRLPPSARVGLPAPDAFLEALVAERIVVEEGGAPLEVRYTVDPGADPRRRGDPAPGPGGARPRDPDGSRSTGACSATSRPIPRRSRRRGPIRWRRS